MTDKNRSGFARGIDFAAQALGYLAAFAFLSLALTLASRSIHLGPGFKNPLPYAAAALAMNQIGRLLRRWLGEAHPAAPAVTAGPLRSLRAGFRFFLRDTSAFNNTLLLSIAYLLGVGSSAFFTRLGRKKTSSAASDSYWTDTDLGKKEADAYSRPY